ncbi:hypothetical protein ACFVH0_13280 [Streptomyces sp. NPDC127117]|uniref:hypothetical protein n=1 Tax=Streptomyces sp. NPDC127117 TaxID=3345368 RepID=UPI0036400DF2
MKGPTALDNDLASLLRGWMDHADLTIDLLRERLTADHFPDGRIPSRTTLANRFSGVALDDAFVQAVADACSRDADEQRMLLAQAHELKTRGAGVPATAAPPEASRLPSPTDWGSIARAGAELIALQHKYVATQDRLVRAVERSAELERERSSANQLVLVLLALVDKLHRDIDDLHNEQAPGNSRRLTRRPLDEIRAQLSRSEQQRMAADAELVRARSERRKADQLAREAAEQVAALRAEVEELRRGPSVPDGRPAHAGASAGREVIEPHPADATADDVDSALAKAARHLDEKADRLDLLADELHQDNSPDNSPTGIDRPDNSPHVDVTDVTATDNDDEDADEAGDEEENLARQRAMKQMKQQILLRYYELRADPEAYRRVLSRFSPADAFELGLLMYEIATPEEGERVWSTYGSTVMSDDLLALVERLDRSGWPDHASDILISAARGREVPGLLQLINEMEEAGADRTSVLADIALCRAARDIPLVMANLSMRDRRTILNMFRTHRSIGEKQELVRAMYAAGRPDWEISDLELTLGPVPFEPAPTAADTHPTLRLRFPQQPPVPGFRHD